MEKYKEGKSHCTYLHNLRGEQSVRCRLKPGRPIRHVAGGLSSWDPTLSCSPRALPAAATRATRRGVTPMVFKLNINPFIILHLTFEYLYQKNNVPYHISHSQHLGALMFTHLALYFLNQRPGRVFRYIYVFPRQIENFQRILKNIQGSMLKQD